MGLYVSYEDVRLRLNGKVRFTDDPTDENRMSVRLANRLINEAEGKVESDLSPRYSAPFQTTEGTAFKNLPERPTKETIRTLCELMSVIRILETDFGSGSASNGDNYKKGAEERYNKMMEELMDLKDHEGGYKGYKRPPLPGLMLNYQNTQDDGFAGAIHITGTDNGDFPSKRINDPSSSFWTGDYEE